MTIEPLSLNLTAGVQETVTVSMDLTGLPDDTSIQEQVAVTISAPGAPNSPVSVEVNVDVEPSHVTTGCAAGGSSSATLAAFMVAGLMLGLLRLATRCAAGDAVRQAHNGPILSLPKGGVAPAQAAAVRSAETPEASCAVRPSRRRSPAARPYRLAVGP